MARIIGGVDPANDHSFSSVWNLNSDIVSQSFNDGSWPEVAGPNVTIKAWGAGGAGGYWNGGTAGNGGAGGFAKGSLTLTPGTSIYIVVGARGTVEGSTVASSAGGNGGAGSGTSGHKGGSGGGFSGVFLGSSASDVTQANALLIAGGGGGGGSYDRSGEDESGGGGGGSSGAAGVNSPNAGGGGTQSAGGTAGSGAVDGSALQGGASQNASGMYAGGGGGGYWGGGGGSVTGGDGAEETGGGGGGSGFVKSTMTSTVNLAGNNGTAGSATGYQTTVNASADDLGGLDYGKGGGYNTSGYKGYVSITDGVGTRTFDTSQTVTIRNPNTTTVTAQVWGGGGGGGNSSSSGDGGDGGIVKASGAVGIGTVLKIVVGNGGTGYRNQDTGQLQGNASDPMRGGYIYSDENNQTGAQGGSGSGVFTTSVSQANALVVAGGGGGGCGNNNADGGVGGGSTSASSSLAGGNGTSPGSSYWRGLGASTSAGGASRDSGVSSGAGAALIGGFSGTATSTNSGYSSGGSGAGGYWGGGGARHGSSANEQGGGGGGSSYVEGTWTRLSATGMTPKAGAPGQNGAYSYLGGANGQVIIIDGAGSTTYSTPGTFDHTVS